MSSHTSDFSGQRPLQVTMNDPARTAYWTSAKAGDDVAVQLGGVREVRVQVAPAMVRVERRQFVSRKQVLENGRPVKDEAGDYVFEETPYEGWVLVLPGSINLFGRTSLLEGQEGYELTPHTTLSAKRWKDLHFTESGKLVEESDLGTLLGLPVEE